MSAFKDLTGKIFGLLTVLSLHSRENGKILWLCECSCGNTSKKIADGQNLRVGDTKSCGCLHKKIISNLNKTHGLSKTKEHRIWCLIKDRCYNKNNPNYHNYGGRGIIMDEEWKNSFEKFLLDMEKCPPDKESIDRIDNDGNYCKENCRWATREEQNNNQRSNILLTHNGKTQNVTQWSKELGINQQTLFTRINKGLVTEQVLSTKINYRNKKHDT